MKGAVLLVLLLASSASAKEPNPLAWSDYQEIPDWISHSLVATNMILDGVDAFKTNDREKWNFACRTGISYGVSELLKRVVHRERPNGTDKKSFPSMHTALATSSAGYKPAWGASFAISVAWGRQASESHFPFDTGIGAAIGITAMRLCNSLIRQETP